MKNIYKLIIFIFIFTASCDKDRIDENLQDDNSIENINGKWKVISYEDYETASITVKNDVDSWNGLDVIITFKNDSLWGYCTTNQISGKYTLSGRNIHIDNYVGTKIAQPVWGTMFVNVVYDLESFEVNEHRLRFFYDDSHKSVTMSRD